ncbi:hypothetical protein EHR_12815 [Enterococcus hirae ATCC 9790]|uniref:Uncharacterized protein n=1 Tax=Enterococcus hirae (strain ATCC 9790 / DSM 20160 / JCM 8729 / LMG 6399 / NBRC 3181 / NCIMB 6459 / NCDO 1258 / NCTC 12367 / WDCM 00089 / R) TaxID=768486 RepID=I6SFJ8_ENTHA|nr:hypothetical protein EHR_12815 [Enterococcus hirae ATCC 9790]
MIILKQLPMFYEIQLYVKKLSLVHGLVFLFIKSLEQSFIIDSSIAPL